MEHKKRKSTFSPEVSQRARAIIKDLMNDRGISQKEMGEMLDLSPESISRLLTGKHHATIQLLINLCYRFDVNANYLLIGAGEKVNIKIAS